MPLVRTKCRVNLCQQWSGSFVYLGELSKVWYIVFVDFCYITSYDGVCNVYLTRWKSNNISSVPAKSLWFHFLDFVGVRWSDSDGTLWEPKQSDSMQFRRIVFAMSPGVVVFTLTGGGWSPFLLWPPWCGKPHPANRADWLRSGFPILPVVSSIPGASNIFFQNHLLPGFCGKAQNCVP